MPIEIANRYELILKEHHYASDFRVRLFRGWCLMYAALAAAFVWAQETSKASSWIISAVAALVTLLMWIADARNRSGIHASKDVGVAIENDELAGIPKEQRFFVRIQAEGRLEKLLTHSMAINIFAVVVFVGLVAATAYLFTHKGALPQ